METVVTVVTSNVHIAKSSDLESNLFNKSWIQFLFSQLHMTVLNQNQRPELQMVEQREMRVGILFPVFCKQTFTVLASFRDVSRGRFLGNHIFHPISLLLLAFFYLKKEKQ